MPYEETSKEKAKREAYMKANKERGIRQEAERDYKMFGTTEQNIPQVNPMGDATMPASAGMKKGGKVKKMAKGGSAHSRADGIAQKGHTRGKYC